MSAQFQKFNALHRADKLFVLPNAWDARSAQLFEESKFQAVGTSSAAVATGLGYEDGEGMPFQDYLFVIRRILASVKIPLTVDMEMGYGKTTEEICKNILKVADLGVVGINIEDSLIRDSKRSIQEANKFAKVIAQIKNTLVSQSLDVYINLRCDTYILGVDNKREETKKRLAIYNNSGADGIFLPCITDPNDITDAIANTRLPLNVMCLPGLPDFDTLNRLGVKRASMGPFMLGKVYGAIGTLSQAVTSVKNFSPIL
jgi:2-methylisocitrate lyase-like PEP mutase family enzyme